MEYLFAQACDESDIRTLLMRSQLPHEDLTPTHLQHFLTVREGEQLVGVVGLEILGMCALLRSLAVAPPWRGQGLGSQLVERIEAYARSCKVLEVYLLTTTARHFFAKLGYTEVDRATLPVEIKGTQEFQKLCPASSVCMVRSVV